MIYSVYFSKVNFDFLVTSNPFNVHHVTIDYNGNFSHKEVYNLMPFDDSYELLDV